MPRMTADQVAKKWREKMQNSGPAYVAGVDATDKDPIQLAIAAAPRWLEGVQAAAAEQRYERGLGRSSKQKWQAACREKGVAALQAGAKMGEANVRAAESIIGPLRDAARASLPARGTYEQNKLRSSLMQDAMHALKGRV